MDKEMPDAKAIVKLFESCLESRGTAHTEMFADLWMELHEHLDAPPSIGSLPEKDARFVSYMQLGVKDPISPFDAELEDLFLTHYDKDDYWCPRDNKEAEWIEKELGYPAVLIAECAAQLISRSRVILGVCQSILKNSEGELVDCVFKAEHKMGEESTYAFAISEQSGDFKAIIDRKIKHIDFIADVDSDVEKAVHAIIGESASPEFGYTFTRHVVNINKNFPYALLDDPAQFIHQIISPPVQMWFVGKDQAFNENANLAILDPVHVFKSVFHHALTFFSANSEPENWRYLEAWCVLVGRMDRYLHDLTDDYEGVPPALLSAMEDAEVRWKDGIPPRERWTISDKVEDLRRANKNGDKRTRMKWGPMRRPVKLNQDLLPTEIRELERSRWERYALARDTPAPVDQAGEPCLNCGKIGPHRCRL